MMNNGMYKTVIYSEYNEYTVVVILYNDEADTLHTYSMMMLHDDDDYAYSTVIVMLNLCYMF